MRRLLAARCMRENCGTPRRRGTEVAAGREEAETKPEAAAMTGIEAETVTVTEIGIGIVTGGIVTVTETGIGTTDVIAKGMSEAASRRRRLRPREARGQAWAESESYSP
mmetsp:Transcript_14638/g.20539  ORF Transcript_14638/g.20539 Transcript_14638/m.20539 type:complete len:109 (-) Transcript_14638:7-333(-)